MLIFDFKAIGNKLQTIQKRTGMTQSEVAEAAGLSDRTYADITPTLIFNRWSNKERGSVNMRTETILRICRALQITPDDILTKENYTLSEQQAELIKELDTCSPKEKETALHLLSVYLHSLK